MPVPLDQVSITFRRNSYYVGEDRAHDVTISGAELAAVLAWMTREGLPCFTDGEYHVRTLRGLGHICRRLASSPTLGDYPDLDAEMLAAIGEVLVDYAARVEVTGEDEKKSILSRIKATITLAAPAAEAPTAVA